jgi:phage minor structural protein
MIPILFPATETMFDTQGLGALTDAISCLVTEERNGMFELTMQYPMSGIHFEDITDRSIIYAIPSPYRLPQPFRVYRITKPMNGIVTVYAQHLTYDLSGVPLNPFTAANAPDAMAGLQSNAAVDSPFMFWTDKDTVAQFSVNIPSATRAVLGGQTGSILDVYGGEYEWDKYTVKLHGQRGQDNGVVIRYGKNLTDIEQDRNISNVATGIYPYWKGSDDTLVTCEPKVVPAPGTYDFTRVVPVDFSQDFEEQPTPQQLQERAEQYVQANKIGVPTVSIKASFVQLEQTEEYKDLALLERCDLCDTVTIQFEALGVDAKAEIVKIETNVLLERYNSVEIGDSRTNIADTIAGQQQEIQKRPTASDVESIAQGITSTILGAKGGAVRLLDTNNDGEPDTLYIADNPDPALAKKVWRFNYEGWGASANGYNGPFTVAATLEQGLYADFMTAGTLNAALVKVVNLIADHVKSQSSGNTMEIDAASFELSAGSNLRASITASPAGSANSNGLIKLYYGTVDASGKMGSDARMCDIQPSYIKIGATSNGGCVGTLETNMVDTEYLKIGNTLHELRWVTVNINGTNYTLPAST